MKREFYNYFLRNKSIIAIFGFFAIGLIATSFMVVFSTFSNHSVVEKDYYEAGLKFQNIINSTLKSEKMSAEIAPYSNSQFLFLKNNKQILDGWSGSLKMTHFKNPDNDFTMELNLKGKPISLPKLYGKYWVEINLKKDNKVIFKKFETKIF